MPRSRIEMNRRRRLTSETIPPPPPEPERAINGIPESAWNAELEAVKQGAMANPELCALATRFLDTQAIPEARALVEAILALPNWSLDQVENFCDKVLVAAESLAAVVNEKRDEEFARTMKQGDAS